MLALGLMVIGIPYAYIWGILAALLRYVPYLGPWMAAVFPLFVSLVMPGWTAFFAVLGFFVVLELIHSNVTEPLIFGHSIGVSGVALLVSALFWTWLWGPLGLVLSIPLTACLFVFGRNIPSLEFLSLMLGDEPVLKKSAMFYQRLLARDPEEAEELVEMYLKDHSVEQVYQDVLFPALMHARRDREADALTEEDHAFVLEATRDIFNDVVLPMHLKNQPQPKDKVSTPRSLVLTIPAQDETDALALDIFKEALNPDLFEAISATPNFLDNGKKNELRQTPSHVVLLTLSNKNLLRFRVLAKKIKASYPNAKIIVGCWGIEKDMELARDRLVAIGVDGVGTTFAETRELLNPSNETRA